MEQRLWSNIWKYTVFLITNKRVFIAILAVYYLTVPGVDALGISYILLASNITGFIFEIPSGYIADLIGHKNTLIISRILAVTSSIMYLISNDLTMLILAGVFLSLTNAFTSGTTSAFLHDNLKSLNRENEYGKISGKIKSLGFAIPLLISVFVPFLVAINFRAPFVIGLIMDLIGLAVSLMFVNPPVVAGEVKEFGIKNFTSILKEGYKLGYLKYALFAGVLSGMLFAFSTFRAPYQEAAGAVVIYFGIFFGMGRLFASVMLWRSDWILSKFTMKRFFFFEWSIYAIILLILGLSSNAWLVVILFALQNGFKWGLTEVEDSYLIKYIRNSRFKATLLSIGAQGDNLVAAVAGFVLGYVINSYGYQTGFLYFSFMFILVMGLLYYLVFMRNFTEAKTN